MDFDFSTLVTDRSPSDLELLRDLLSTPMSDWTAEQLAAFNQAASKGAYNYTDLNRVTACMDYLNEVLTGLGYVTGYVPVEVPHSGSGSRLPEGYTEPEYIESSGTQYIDTGFKPNQDTRVVMDVQCTHNISDAMWLYCGRTGANNSAFGAFFVNGNQAFGAAYGNEQEYYVHSGLVTDRLNIDQNKSTIKISSDIHTFSSATFTSSANLVIFARNNNGTIDGFSAARFYSCKIYNNSNLIRNYIPCISDSGEVGLYDTVNALFYGNEGTGAFVAGPQLVTLPDGYKQLEYIKSSGAQWIETGVDPDQNTVLSKEFYGNSGTGTFIAGPEIAAPDTPDEPTEELDPYTWYEDDIPTVSTMQSYLTNVSALRGVLTLGENTPAVPGDMAGLTLTEANNIEQTLDVVNDYLVAFQKIFLRSGMVWAVSGGPGFYFQN